MFDDTRSEEMRTGMSIVEAFWLAFEGRFVKRKNWKQKITHLKKNCGREDYADSKWVNFVDQLEGVTGDGDYYFRFCAKYVPTIEDIMTEDWEEVDILYGCGNSLELLS